jgi:hypothetical protein
MLRHFPVTARISKSPLQQSAQPIAKVSPWVTEDGGDITMSLMGMVTLLHAIAHTQPATVLGQMASQLRVFSLAPQTCNLKHRFTPKSSALRASKLLTSAAANARACQQTTMRPTRVNLQISLQSALATTGRNARTPTFAPALSERKRSFGLD